MLLHDLTPTPLAELFLFLADRAEHIQKVVAPNSDKTIVSDRGFLSGIAYARAKTDVGLKTLQEFNDLALQGHYPDKIVFFEITPQELKRRMGEAPLDTIEERGVEYLLEVQAIMKDLLSRYPLPSLIIDATRPKEEIFHDILAFIKDEND